MLSETCALLSLEIFPYLRTVLPSPPLSLHTSLAGYNADLLDRMRKLSLMIGAVKVEAALILGSRLATFLYKILTTKDLGR